MEVRFLQVARWGFDRSELARWRARRDKASRLARGKRKRVPQSSAVADRQAVEEAAVRSRARRPEEIERRQVEERRKAEGRRLAEEMEQQRALAAAEARFLEVLGGMGRKRGLGETGAEEVCAARLESIRRRSGNAEAERMAGVGKRTWTFDRLWHIVSPRVFFRFTTLAIREPSSYMLLHQDVGQWEWVWQIF